MEGSGWVNAFVLMNLTALMVIDQNGHSELRADFLLSKTDLYQAVTDSEETRCF